MFGMKKQDVMSIAITAAVGFFGGVFMFFSYANSIPVPIVASDVPTQPDEDAFSVTAEAYGVCAENCPSFRLLENGSYRYRFVENQGEAPQIAEGTLPLGLQSDLKQALDSTELVIQSELIDRTTCLSDSGSVDFQYTIEFETETFILDSCTTTIDDQSDLWLALTAIWNYLQTAER